MVLGACWFAIYAAEQVTDANMAIVRIIFRVKWRVFLKVLSRVFCVKMSYLLCRFSVLVNLSVLLTCLNIDTKM